MQWTHQPTNLNNACSMFTSSFSIAPPHWRISHTWSKMTIMHLNVCVIVQDKTGERMYKANILCSLHLCMKSDVKKKRGPPYLVWHYAIPHNKRERASWASDEHSWEWDIVAYFFFNSTVTITQLHQPTLLQKLHHGVSKLKATTNKIQETMKISRRNKQNVFETIY